jgi:very-short-patch-repair endonuclease
MTEYEHRLKTYARTLRSRQTEAKQKLWYHLRRDQLGVRFYRQRPLGHYILDFYAPKAKLVLELDGSQHVDDPVQSGKDAQRDAWLLSQGLKILRFDDRQVLTETQAVLAVIFQAVHQATVTAIPPGPPLRKGGEPLTPSTEGSLPFVKGGQEGFSNASIPDEAAT